MTHVPTFADIQDAARQLKGMAVRTPLVEAHVMGAALGCRLFVKPEVLQRTIEPFALLGGRAERSGGGQDLAVTGPERSHGVPADHVLPSRVD